MIEPAYILRFESVTHNWAIQYFAIITFVRYIFCYIKNISYKNSYERELGEYSGYYII